MKMMSVFPVGFYLAIPLHVYVNMIFSSLTENTVCPMFCLSGLYPHEPIFQGESVFFYYQLCGWRPNDQGSTEMSLNCVDQAEVC